MKKKFIIEGMTCTSCVNLNEKSLKSLEGVKQITINLATNEASIEYDENKIKFDDIVKEIESNGFKVNEDIEKKESTGKKDNKELNRFIFSLVFSLPVFSMMFVDTKIGISYLGADISMIIFAVLSAIVVFVFGGHFHKNAYKSLLRFHFNMDSLVSLGTLTAFFYSLIAIFYGIEMVYFEASVAIITLINLGKYLEMRAKTKSSDATKKLLELGAKKAYIEEKGKIIEKNPDDIIVGEIIIVRAGEKIALDGEIIFGEANIQESMLTGESIPVYKKSGDYCYGGTINLDGNIKIKVNKTNNEGTLANIIKLVNEAQSSKAPIQHLVDKISGIFVPIIIIISIITFISWYMITGDIGKAIIPAVASLVIACPCALGLATPTAIIVGTGVGASRGILIKNAETLEKTKDIDVVIFDKTGTLTNGKPEITDIISISKNEKEMISLAKSISILSHHPLSVAIANYGEEEIKKVNNFSEIKGKGIMGVIDEKLVKLGNKKMFEYIDNKTQKEINSLSKEGKTPIIIGNNEEIFGIIGLIDMPKEGVKSTIEKLYKMNIEVIMLTGDTKNTAEYVANKIGINKVLSEVMPEDKLNTIKELQKQNKKVAFVGDGINDAPALTQADLSIAMGTGSDIAISSSDIILVKGNLEKVVSAINLSRRTLSIIKQNLFWAFIYNTMGIPLAFLGILNPVFASFAMSMSSVSVVSNSLRLKKFRN